MAKRKLICQTREDALNYLAYDGGNLDSSDDERDLINIPPENDVSEDEGGDPDHPSEVPSVDQLHHHQQQNPLTIPIPIPPGLSHSHIQQADYDHKNVNKTSSLINEAKYLQLDHAHDPSVSHAQNLPNLHNLTSQQLPYMGMQYHQLSHNCNIYHSVIGQFSGEHSKYLSPSCHSHSHSVTSLCNVTPMCNAPSSIPHNQNIINTSPSPRKRICLDPDWRYLF